VSTSQPSTIVSAALRENNRAAIITSQVRPVVRRKTPLTIASGLADTREA
jgi:hypothetical protein